MLFQGCLVSRFPVLSPGSFLESVSTVVACFSSGLWTLDCALVKRELDAGLHSRPVEPRKLGL